jgi:hypothetical protein
MKSLITFLTLLLAVSALPVHAADKDKEKDLPPGLRKKDKLPPGWEKKQKQGNNDDANGVPPSPNDATPKTEAKTNAPVAKPAELKAALERHFDAINKLDDKPASRQAGFATISKETGVPLKVIAAQHQAHPKMGTAGLMMGNLIAKKSGKSFHDIMTEANAGKNWHQIAAEYKLNLAEINTQASRIEQAMRTAK